MVRNVLKVALQILFIFVLFLMLITIKLNTSFIIIISTLICILLVRFFSKDKKKFLLVISVLFIIAGLVARLYYMYNLKFDLVSDFKLYYDTAIGNLDAWYLSFNGYVCVFSSILSLVFKVFGESIHSALWFNLVCQVLTVGCLYKIISRFAKPVIALFFSSVWFIIPGVIAASFLISTETFFMLLLSVIIYLYFSVRKLNPNKFISYLIVGMFGILISFANNIRPVMAIFIIALIIDFILNSKKFKEILLLVPIIGCFILSNILFNNYVENFIGIPTRSGALEWSLYFGANYDYKGYWNLEDSESLTSCLDKENGSKLLLDAAILRYKDMGILKTAKLLGYKYYYLWSDVNANFDFLDSIVINRETTKNIFFEVCGFTIVASLYVGSLLSVIMEIKNKKFNLWFIELFSFGYILANILVVVNGRYNYPMFFLASILCANLFSSKNDDDMVSYIKGSESSVKDKITKLWYVFKKYGFIGFCKKCYAYVVANYFDKVSLKVLLNKKKYEKEIQEILRLSSYDRIILWRSSFGYNVPLFQRPQHIANNLSRNKCLVFYEVTTMTDKVKTLKRFSNNLYLFNFNNVALNKILMQVLEKAKEPKYIQLYSTDWKLTSQNIEDYMSKGYGFIYEYIDDLSPELAGTKDLPKNIVDKYEYVMTHDNVYVVVTAAALEEKVVERRGRKNLAFSSNGVDYDFFKSFDQNFSFDEDFKSVLLAGKSIMCYYGALAKWFDYELIRKINETDRYSIVLFGIKYDESYDESGIEHLKNVYFMGPRDYKVLKNYANKCDIMTIPFQINQITEATSPVKIFEYMALHKPIVITDLRECRQYESVLIGKTHEEFIANLDKAMELKNDEKYLKLLDKEAKENDWSTKARAIIDLIAKDEKDESDK